MTRPFLSAACDMGISSSYHGVMTMRSAPSSRFPTAPRTRKPTESTIRTLQCAPSPRSISAARSGTNFGSAVMIDRPEPLCGSSSFARSR
jgi:hypothetical protein